jgi:hypothetical protein
MQQFRRAAAHIVFIAGIFLMLSGIFFLLGTIAGVSRLSVLWSFLFVIIGALCAVFAIKLSKRAVYLFLATFFVLIGSFLFLSTLGVIPFPLAQSWPLLSIFAGLALFPAGWRYYRAVRYRYLIPSVAFVTLGCILLVFSFKMAPFSFRRFVIGWWPLLMVMAGIILVLLSLSSKGSGKTGSGDADP